MTEVAKCGADRKYRLLRSYRGAILRQCFNGEVKDKLDGRELTYSGVL